MTFDDFEKRCAAHGLKSRKCSYHHWQILGGSTHAIVNVWPLTNRGFRYQVGQQKSRIGTVDDALEIAGPVSVTTELHPWEEQRPPERVGLIRWLWRMLW